MEKLLNPYDKEYMKMAMLKHEETFREQVYELHRLYQIQKLLMKNIASSSKRGQELGTWDFATATNSNKMINNDNHQDIHKRARQGFDLERPAEVFLPGIEEGRGILEIEDETELELTLGPTSQCRRRRTLETPLASDSAASLSSSSTGSSHIKRSNSGNHQIINRTRNELMGQKWSLDIPSSTAPGFINRRKNSSDVEEQLRQDRHNNPPWLFQALSLNTS